MKFALARWLTIVAAAALIVLALPAAAADDSHGGGVGVLIKTAINLALLLGVIVYFARKPVLEYFENRRRAIEEELTEAANELSDAEATFSKWQRRLGDLESELEQIRSTSRQRAESERERIIADAQAAAQRIRANASAAITQELRRAREQLREEATQLAIEMAAQRLAREVTDADHDRLLDEFIDRVEQSDAGAGIGPRGGA
ncbi:MAG: F0F1 ATP synthase subunit B [Myxococcota bacterium]